MRRPVAILPSFALLLACQLGAAAAGESVSGPHEPSSTDGTLPRSTSASAVANAGGARKVSISNDLIDFEFGYPAAAGAIPALKRMLDADLEKHKRDLIASATQGRKDAKQGGYDFHAFGEWIDWQVVTDLSRWLSLSAQVGSYEGGAHPNQAFDTILWDKRASRRRDPLSLFASKQALSRAMRADFCKALDRQRENKRGEPVSHPTRGIFDELNKCIDPAAETIILGSSDRQSFNRIGVLVPPYEAGPYVEGSYEVTLPVTPAILAAVKPEFRASFAVRH